MSQWGRFLMGRFIENEMFPARTVPQWDMKMRRKIMERKFTEIDEEFICENCGKKVEKLGYSCRNHCNYCLHSKHVDINPGDRLEECHGLLEPVGIEMSNKKGYVIVYRCKKCGQIRKNKAAKDDDFNMILKISKNVI